MVTSPFFIHSSLSQLTVNAKIWQSNFPGKPPSSTTCMYSSVKSNLFFRNGSVLLVEAFATAASAGSARADAQLVSCSLWLSTTASLTSTLTSAGGVRNYESYDKSRFSCELLPTRRCSSQQLKICNTS